MHSPTGSTSTCRIRCTISCGRGDCAASISQGRFCTPPRTRGAEKIRSGPVARRTRARRTAHAVPLVADATALAVSPDELKAAILLFFSVLDEQQRRLFAGLESIKWGRGGDTLLATFLNLDPHTVARGRQQLLDHDVAPARIRRAGAGRTPVEKKRPTSSP
jgi:hypothetical protein